VCVCVCVREGGREGRGGERERDRERSRTLKEEVHRAMGRGLATQIPLCTADSWGSLLGLFRTLAQG
jgi:hypothetical protein